MIANKIMAVLQELQDRGWKCHAYGDLKGWGIYVEYIDEGPEFGYLVRLDPIAWSPYFSYRQVADIVQREALDAMEVR